MKYGPLNEQEYDPETQTQSLFVEGFPVLLEIGPVYAECEMVDRKAHR